MTMRTIALTLLFLAGCGDQDGGATGSVDDDRGFTECGDFEECQPGQYCEDSVFGECAEGCLSNVNCASDQVCSIPDGQSVGTCENTGKNSGGGGGGNGGNGGNGGDGGGVGECASAEEDDCLAMCDIADACGTFTPADYAGCVGICGYLEGEDQIVDILLTCVERACEDECRGVDTCLQGTITL